MRNANAFCKSTKRTLMLNYRPRLSFKLLPIPLLLLVLVNLWLLHSRRAEAEVSQGSKVHDLQQQRLATLSDIVERTREHFTNGLATSDDLWSAVKAREKAALELCTSDKERIAILEKALNEAKLREDQEAKLAANKLLPETTLLQAKADRLEQEILLEQAKNR